MEALKLKVVQLEEDLLTVNFRINDIKWDIEQLKKEHPR